MKVAECQFCSRRIEFAVVDLGKMTGRWMHHETGLRRCGHRRDGGWAYEATPMPGTVKKTVEDVQVTDGRV